MTVTELQINKSRLGGLKRIELYGNPGTPEGRIKGGKKTTEFYRLNPSLAKASGFIIRKKIKHPNHCLELAEFMGVILGDGGLPGNHQLTISFNKRTDQEYAKYLQDVCRKLFGISSYIYHRKNSDGAEIIVSSSNLVDFLVKEGLRTGHKVKNQVDVPCWINKKAEYQKACLRGLIDTDGSFYRHEYIAGLRKYRYLKMCFTNCSKPLLNFVFDILNKRGFKVYLHGNNVLLYSIRDINKYFSEIGTHNQKHFIKFKKFVNN